jgi:hybrid cluster-associated redox disulfide protein
MQITKDMSISEVVQKYPVTIEVFRNFGMGCFGCAAARYENIEQGAMAHGVDVEVLVADLNKAAHAQ